MMSFICSKKILNRAYFRCFYVLITATNFFDFNFLFLVFMAQLKKKKRFCESFFGFVFRRKKVIVCHAK